MRVLPRGLYKTLLQVEQVFFRTPDFKFLYVQTNRLPASQNASYILLPPASSEELRSSAQTYAGVPQILDFINIPKNEIDLM